MSGAVPPYDGTGAPPRGAGQGWALSGRTRAVSAAYGYPGAFTGYDASGDVLIGDLNAGAAWAGVLGGQAWPEGSWIEYGPEGKAAHWSGTRFKTGKAPA